jgi:myosin tail region-interacting protein MTI1
MPSPPFKFKAIYDYQSQEPDDLTFPTGQIITVTEDADEDWYTGEYVGVSGDKLEGIFPRNFVEIYEPAVPTRPARAQKRAPAPEPANVQESVPVAEEREVEEQPKPAVPDPEPEKPTPQPSLEESRSSPATESAPVQAPPSEAPRPKPAAAKSPPPPVAEKPTSSSFKDRIAAFNKPAAAPITPFKPSGGGTGFIKKPFVAPPPSKNSYVPPPREPPPQKVYRREEDPSVNEEQERDAPPPPTNQNEAEEDDQPKPTSLKERIALLQKQQLEAAQKKEKPKKPPKKRVEQPVEETEAPPTEAPALERKSTQETVGRPSTDLADESEHARPQVMRQESSHSAQMPPPPSRELVSDTNDADDSGAADTEDAQETSTEEERPRSKGVAAPGAIETRQPAQAPAKPSGAESEESEEDAEDEDEDPEVRRKRELRERMAKMSGGMGMMGMFGPPGGMPAPAARKPRASQEHSREAEQHQEEEAARAPPVPIMALPGMATQLPKRGQQEDSESDEDETAHPTPQEPTKQSSLDDDYISQPPPPPRRSDTTKSTSSTAERPIPPPPQRENRAPPPPSEARAVPPPLPSAGMLPSLEPPEAKLTGIGRSVPPPPPPARHDDEAEEETRVASPTSARSRPSGEFAMSPTGAPPVPGSRPQPDPVRRSTEDRNMSSPITSPQTRAPPPPPPGPPSRRTTEISSPMVAQNDDSDEEVTEYDGDYDTDIASSAKHKDALRESHNRDSSIDDGILTDDATKSPKSPPARTVPPIPPMPAQHTAPPPPPPQAPVSRKSMDTPRAAPPPVPPPAMPNHDEDEYDPFRYNSPSQGMPTPQLNDIYRTTSPGETRDDEDMYGASQPSQFPPPPPTDRSAPPPPPLDRSAPPPPPAERAAPPPPPTMSPEDSSAPKQSTDIRRSTTLSRRSMETQRPTGDGFMATDIDLSHSSFWWTQANLPPPSLTNRPDILYEIEESTSTKRGGHATVSRDIYVLYNDYSQTTINATFDKADPSQVTLEQKHERPPPPPRKDQLEHASETFGSAIAAAAASAAKQGATIGDGTAHGFILDLLRPLPRALPPIGTRSYGGLIYANMSNASTTQYDEIRPGDIISFRNAKFSGHKGGLHQKYSLEAGKPDHVAVVSEWDGTKKKVSALEQRGEEDDGGKGKGKGKRAKVREESYRLGDLMRGEVRVWRVLGRGFVGWGES